MKIWPALVLTVALASPARGQSQAPANVNELQRKLNQATGQIQMLTAAVEELRAEVARMKKNQPAADAARNAGSPNQEQAVIGEVPKEVSSGAGVVDRILGPELGTDERGNFLDARPELFIQTRYSAAPIDGSAAAFDPNFRLSRIEARWAGRIAPRLGAGMEIQFQEAIEGHPEGLVNDAFIEYYASKHSTIRAGQFIKPFGFDIQQSSSVRESPERGIFAGYFFPGQRDRGIMLFGSLDALAPGPFKNLEYFVGVFNGNRFFNDNNRQANTIVRLRKIFDRQHFAVGASMQLGKQILPPGMTGNDNERLFGFDTQYAIGRFGLRAEIVGGNMPSTQVGIQPEFFPAFRPGAHSVGGAAVVSYRITGTNNVYARYDQFNHDPVTGKNVRAVNFGYFRYVGQLSRISIDYQFKNRTSFNDDAVNGRLQVTWGLLLSRQPHVASQGTAGLD